MNLRAAAIFLGAALLSCAAPQHAPRPTPRPRVDGCAPLVAERDALLADGQIARAAKALARPNRACPRVPTALSASRGALLAELGDADEAEGIAARLAASGDDAGRDAASSVRAAIARFAPLSPADDAARREVLDQIDRAAEAFHAKDYARALAGYERAWTAWHPLAKASAGAGLAALALGRSAEGRRVLDRALAEARAPYQPGVVVAPFSASPEATSPDGTLLAVYTGGGFILERASGRFVTALDRPFKGAGPVGFSFHPDGARVACLDGDTLGVYHALSGRRLVSYPLTPDFDVRPVREVTSFSPDGRRVAFVTRGVGVVDLDTGALRYLRYRRSDGPPGAIAWSSDGSRIAVGHSDAVVIWDAKTLRRTRTHRAEGYVLSLHFSERDRMIDVAAAGTAAFYTRRDVVTGAVTRKLVAPADDRLGTITATAELSADGERVARMSEGTGLEVWSTASDERHVITRWPRWYGGEDGVVDYRPRLLFGARADEVLGRCAAGGVCAYDARPEADTTRSPQVIIGPTDATSWAITRSSRGNAVVEVDMDDRVRVWDLVAGELRVVPLVTYCVGTRRPVAVYHANDRWHGRTITLDDTDAVPEPPIRIVDMTPDASSFRIATACGREQIVHGPELAGAPVVSQSDAVHVAGIDGLRAGIVRRENEFDLVGPDADTGAVRARLLCYAGTVFPLEVCEGALRVPGLLRGVEREADPARSP